ncbi:receptor-type tyrosine-protein phosphatase epsilon-like [Littorina saxatilis]|uniref:receptor-type tyrosine-protein phosphatase epsilon-like n=1 Tax=Littorina saxatilis TaxID=31220 RepID=UPI0038B5C21E
MCVCLQTSTPRQVTQYHMVVWPDHGVPSALALVNLQRYISARTDPGSGPLLVHCSAGVGRTGTYIALDMLMQELKAQKQVDVLKTVTRMREDRVIMIQNVDQYVFLHEVLLEAYTSRDARVSVEDVDRVFPTPVNTKTDNSRIDREFKSLCEMKKFVSKQTYTMAQQTENQAKNRDSSVMADDAHLVYLSVHVAGRNQYINAVYVPSFRQQRGMLLTQLPLADTAVDLWRLVEGFDVATIVSLGSSDEEKKQDYCPYWPRVEKTTSKAGPYVIKMTSSDVLGDTLTSYSLSIERGKKLSRNIRLFHLSDWAGETPGRTSDVLSLLGALDTVQSGDTDTPIIIQCRDGARKSGLVCALSNIVSRLTYDRELDVYLTVRHVHNARPQAVTSKAQYRYCYQVALEYKKSFDVYANS